NAASASRTGAASRPSVASMSAWMAGSSAPGTSNSALAGMITPAVARRSSRSAGLRDGGVRLASLSDMRASLEQVGQAALHLVGDIERQRLDRGGRVHPAGG